MNSLREAAGLLERRHWFLLLALGAAAFFQGYDLSIVTVAMRQIRHSFGLTQATASLWIGLLFLGALPAIFLTRQADKRGRRQVLLFSVLGYTVATGLTSLAPTMGAFVTCQFFARLFIATESAIVWTMVAEELPAGSRGFGFGWMAMLGAMGTGMSALLYGAVLTPLGASWRWLYVIAVPPLLGLAWLRKRLPESRRFQLAEQSHALASRWQQVLKPPHRRWLGLLCFTAVLATLTTHAATFAVDFMETSHHLSATKASLLIVGAGAPAIAMLVVAGALSDRYGRKLIGCSFGLLAVVGALTFYFLANNPLSLYLTITITLVGMFGAGPSLGAFATELFPTSLRAMGGSAVSISHVVGQSISLGVGGFLLHATGSMPQTAAVLALGPLAMIVVVAVWFPETHGRELEDIANTTLSSGSREFPMRYELPITPDLAE
jgi:MFS family permease